jgi:hypothetical protein
LTRWLYGDGGQKRFLAELPRLENITLTSTDVRCSMLKLYGRPSVDIAFSHNIVPACEYPDAEDVEKFLGEAISRDSELVAPVCAYERITRRGREPFDFIRDKSRA